MTEAIAIIQARTSSARLPAKVLRKMLGQPMIWHVIEQVKRAHSFEQVVVATSSEASDDQLAEYCQSIGVNVVRGPLENVVARFELVLKQFTPKYFARVCADSPLYDPDLLELALTQIKSGKWDLVTNTLQRSFPKGLSVEVMKSNVFLSTAATISDSQDLEHVTRYFYNNSARFKIQNIRCPKGDFSNLNLSVDTEEDFKRAESILLSRSQNSNGAGWEQLIYQLGAKV